MTTDRATDAPGRDQQYLAAIGLMVVSQRASTSYLSRVLSTGYNTASRIMERMQADRIVSAPNYVGKREVLVPRTDLATLRAEVERLTRERDEFQRQRAMLFDQLHGTPCEQIRHAEDIARLTRERDEARAEIERLREIVADKYLSVGDAAIVLIPTLLEKHETVMRSKGRNPLDYLSKFSAAANVLADMPEYKSARAALEAAKEGE